CDDASGQCVCDPNCPPDTCDWQTNACGDPVWCGDCPTCDASCPPDTCDWQTNACGDPVWCGDCPSASVVPPPSHRAASATSSWQSFGATAATAIGHVRSWFRGSWR